MGTHVSMVWLLSSCSPRHVQLEGVVEGHLLWLERALVHNLPIAHHQESGVAQVGYMQLITLQHQDAGCAAALHHVMSLSHGCEQEHWPSLVLPSGIMCKCDITGEAAPSLHDLHVDKVGYMPFAVHGSLHDGQHTGHCE